MNILAVQQQFCSYLLDGSVALAHQFDRDGAAGLAVYHNAYRMQLVACLRDTFERVWAWLGDDAFSAAARAHIASNPPRSWTLADYGAEFSQTLHTLYPRDPECAELAALDWHLRRAFDGGDSTAVDAGLLEGIDWERAVFRFVPTLRILPVVTNCGAIWSAIAAGNTPPASAPLPAPAAIRIWRSGLSPRFCTIDAIEHSSIELAQSGASFAAVCNALAEKGGDAAKAAENAGRLLAAWLQDGVLAAVEA
jgi:hypothetical protein